MWATHSHSFTDYGKLLSLVLTAVSNRHCLVFSLITISVCRLSTVHSRTQNSVDILFRKYSLRFAAGSSNCRRLFSCARGFSGNYLWDWQPSEFVDVQPPKTEMCCRLLDDVDGCVWRWRRRRSRDYVNLGPRALATAGTCVRWQKTVEPTTAIWLHHCWGPFGPHRGLSTMKRYLRCITQVFKVQTRFEQLALNGWLCNKYVIRFVAGKLVRRVDVLQLRKPTWLVNCCATSRHFQPLSFILKTIYSGLAKSEKLNLCSILSK